MCDAVSDLFLFLHIFVLFLLLLFLKSNDVLVLTCILFWHLVYADKMRFALIIFRTVLADQPKNPTDLLAYLPPLI